MYKHVIFFYDQKSSLGLKVQKENLIENEIKLSFKVKG